MKRILKATQKLTNYFSVAAILKLHEKLCFIGSCFPGICFFFIFF